MKRALALGVILILLGVWLYHRSDARPDVRTDTETVSTLAPPDDSLRELGLLKASRSRPTPVPKITTKTSVAAPPKRVVPQKPRVKRSVPHVVPQVTHSGSASAWAHSHDPIGVANCESGPGHRHPKYDVYVGNIREVSGSYYGKWQFSRSTWRSVGGSGSPAAASESEQDYRAWLLWKRDGWGQWQCAGQLGIS